MAVNYVSNPAALRNQSLVALSVLVGGIIGVGATLDLRLTLIALGAAILLALPIRVQFSVLVISAMVTRYVVHLGPVTLRFDQICMLPLLFRTVVEHVKSRVASARPGLRHWTILLLFGGWVAVGWLGSLAMSADRLQSVKDQAWITLSVITLFVVADLLIRGRINLSYAKKAFSWALLAECAVGVMAYLLHFRGIYWGVQIDPLLMKYAAYGTAWEANIFGSYGVLSTAFWLDTFLQSPNVVGLTGVLVSLAAVAVSLTRAAWIAAFVVMALMLLFRVGKYRRQVLIVGVMGTAMTVLLLMGKTFRAQFDRIGVQSADLQLRFVTDGQALSTWAHGAMTHWLFGYGADSWGFTHFTALTATHAVPGWIGTQPVQTLYDTGFVGLFFFGAAFLYLLVGSVRIAQVELACLGALVGIAITYETTTALWFGFNWILVAVVVASIALEGRPHGI